jgi:hypothetical protein
MLNCLINKPRYFNPNMRQNCLQITLASIKNIVDNSDKERNFIDETFKLVTTPNSSENNKIFAFICVISISSLICYWYKSRSK